LRVIMQINQLQISPHDYAFGTYKVQAIFAAIVLVEHA
jgi:hypothetical protein